MTKNGAGAQETKVTQPGQRRLAMATEHFLKLDERLRHVNLHGHIEPVRSTLGVLEQGGGAGIHLGWREEAAHAVVIRPAVLFDEGDSPFEPFLPSRLVPLITDLLAIGGIPAPERYIWPT